MVGHAPPPPLVAATTAAVQLDTVETIVKLVRIVIILLLWFSDNGAHWPLPSNQKCYRSKYWHVLE